MSSSLTSFNNIPSDSLVSNDSEYSSFNNTLEKWKWTSNWTQEQLDILNIEYRDADKLEDIRDINSIEELYSESIELFLPGVNLSDNPFKNKKLTSNQKLFISEVQKSTIKFDDELIVDGLISRLLDATYFINDKINFRRQPKIEVKWKDYNIISKADFGVYNNTNVTNRFTEYLMIVEDKKMTLKSKIEHQLAGELFTSLCGRESYSLKDYTNYGVANRGVYFRFYGSKMTATHYKDISKDKKPLAKLIIYRYPKECDEPLSLVNEKDREQILKIMSSIRQDIETSIIYLKDVN
ncbi:hypothetical protein HDU92_002491 [Lobulomyces angularis]|nr:hypothetical protein HDU92_002491 [Lobulomyces angularis]